MLTARGSSIYNDEIQKQVCLYLVVLVNKLGVEKRTTTKRFWTSEKGVDQGLNKQLDHILRKLNEGVLTTVDPTRD